METRSRHAKFVLIVLSLCLGITGCLGLRNDDPPSANSSPVNISTVRASAYGDSRNMPQGNSGIVTTSNVQSAAYFPQRARIGPASGGMPGQVWEGPSEPMAGSPGIVSSGPEGMMVGGGDPPIPTELAKSTAPPHRVAPSDILLLEALRMIPRGPYRLDPMEVLQIEVTDTLPKQDIRGNFMISPEGNINLGYNYGTVRVGGLTIEQAQLAIRNQLGNILKNPTVNVALLQMRGLQNVRGEHLVRPDGTISLGMYGSVYVAGMNLGQIKCVIETHLSAYLLNPQISVDMFAYNSRKIYIIADGAGYGQQVIPIPATGYETVLDAISRVQGLPPVSSQRRIWVARPSPAGHPCSIILPVDWKAITQAGRTETNYQLMPGDRIYISGDPWILAYNTIDKMLAPIERVLGVTLLATSVANSFRGNNNGGTAAIIAR